jgi:DNA-3-methyladenine glycosylase
MKLRRPFLTHTSLIVAKKLLGAHMVRKIGARTLVGKIVEVESYPGPHDRASHAFGMKKTSRNEAEYRQGGHIYIYLVYGMHWQLNISTGREGYPECVLIRALEPVLIQNAKIKTQNDSAKLKNLANSGGRFPVAETQAERVRRRALRMRANGPGKLCRWMKFDKSFYGEDVTASKRIWFEKADRIQTSQIASGPRIGIEYAGKTYARKPWRFWLKGNSCVSR